MQTKYATTKHTWALNVNILILSALLYACHISLYIIVFLLSEIPQNYFFDVNSLATIITSIELKADLLKIAAILILGIALIVTVLLPDSVKIAYAVRRTLFDSKFGNPLNFKEGELLPHVTCNKIGIGEFELIITAVSVTCEDIADVSPSISAGLTQKFKCYAVTNTDIDVAFNEVRFTIEDVTTDKSLHIKSVNELKPKEVVKLIVQQNSSIDLTTSGSMLVAGKTRSGKTTAIISLLLQALLSGRDDYGSEIVIIDPKQAELSRLPHVYTLDENGEATEILNVIQRFSSTITKRQQVLNYLSEKKGDVVKWWEADMHVSFLFVDEYVSARTIFPKKATKENPDYCLATFDGLIKRIVTMGASAGCYMTTPYSPYAFYQEMFDSPAKRRNDQFAQIERRITLTVMCTEDFICEVDFHSTNNGSFIVNSRNNPYSEKNRPQQTTDRNALAKLLFGDEGSEQDEKATDEGNYI